MEYSWVHKTYVLMFNYYRAARSEALPLWFLVLYIRDNILKSESSKFEMILSKSLRPKLENIYYWFRRLIDMWLDFMYSYFIRLFIEFISVFLSCIFFFLIIMISLITKLNVHTKFKYLSSNYLPLNHLIISKNVPHNIYFSV